jgi:hypothetical protein
MFTKSLDGKPLYMNDDGVEMVDIMQGMYNGLYDFSLIHSVYRANIKCTMRPDYLAACLYGDEAYAEIAMKSAMLFNPFALEKGDTVYAMTMDNIYHNVKESIMGPGGDSFYEMVKKYHKYIDPDKVPEADGSEPNTVVAKKQYIEPNISKTGKTGVHLKGRKIYFGKNSAASDKMKDDEERPKDGVSAAETGSFSPNIEDGGLGLNSDDAKEYSIASTINVGKEGSPDDNSLYFDLDDNIEEVYGKALTKKRNVRNNNAVLKDGKVFFTPDSDDIGDDEEAADILDGMTDGNISDIERDIEIPVDSDDVNCARSGVSLGSFLNSAVNSCDINVMDNNNEVESDI